MRAEKSVNRVTWKYKRYIRKISALKNSMDRASDFEYAQRMAREAGLAEGKAEGKIEGLKEGKIEGKSEGIAEGIIIGEASGNERVLNIARKMKKANKPLTEIIEFTGLSQEEIEKL